MRFADWVESNLEVAGRQADGEWTVRCFYHGDTRASMRVNVRKQVFVCLACGVKGTGRTLMKDYGQDAVVIHADISDVKRKLHDLGTQAAPAKRLPESWLAQFDQPTDYWHERGFDTKLVKMYRLGYEPSSHAVTIPLRDMRTCQPIGVIRRFLDPDARPRYSYPVGFARNEQLWGLCELRRDNMLNAGPLALVEGSLDAVAMRAANIPAVAILGSHLAPHQAKLIRDAGVKRVVICTDNDKAGRNAAEAAVATLSGLQIRLGHYQPGWGKDPGELTIEQRRKLYSLSVPVATTWQARTHAVS